MAASSSAHDRTHAIGVALCVTSAVAFGLMAIFAKQAYAAGVTVATLLALRFGLAASVFWVIVAVRRAAPPARGAALAGILLGAVGYALQSGLFFGSLTRIDASLAALLLYLYPALVFAGALLLGRERGDRVRVGALALATVGAALVLAGGGAGRPDVAGIVMAAGAAVAYAVYILSADRVVAAADAFAISALICTGAAATLGTFGALSGELSFGFGADGWPWIVALALGSTVVAVSFFLLSLPRVGPATASIVSTVEPVVTVALATALLGERLGGTQLVGGALVVAAVVLLQAKVRSRGPAAEPAGTAAAGTLAREPAGG